MTTSRERVLQAINHQEPDRVPIDLGGHRSSGIMAIAYKKLKDYLGIAEGDIYVYDFVQQLAIIEPPVLDRFGVDTIELGRGFSLQAEDWHEWVLPDGTPCKIPATIE
ncbi:MAG: methyltransferase, partial [Chloroflexi bacterium]|nr:methyltransferase [Chloroflexota bacterium]